MSESTTGVGTMSRRDNRGFTLVELMIAVTVIGILATVAIPMFQVVPERSKSTEAVTALGLIRSAMRIYYVEHGSYANAALFTDGAQVTNGGMLGVTDSDLMGRYFSSECYTFRGAATANSFTIECDGSASTAPFAAEVAAVVVTIDQDGELTRVF
ncbi:MAG: prepilin-type N-terminal cleavage/methylation domain-containing protein [Candidatus Eisenbacteria bacterium]|nr:prepilin-type N-terminal cleavage/methylation domain-containing protein [Candidatus Eisenbacteria bacterium]